MPVVARRAGRRDLESIEPLWLALRQQEAKLDARLVIAAGAERVARSHWEVILADRTTAIFVADDQGELVGFLHAEIRRNEPAYRSERFGEIVDLFVSEPHRSRGIGARLLETAVEWFDSHNAPEYRVSALVASPDAARFFERHGAQPLSLRLAAPISSG